MLDSDVTRRCSKLPKAFLLLIFALSHLSSSSICLEVKHGFLTGDCKCLQHVLNSGGFFDVCTTSNVADMACFLHVSDKGGTQLGHVVTGYPFRHVKLIMA